MAKKKTYSFSIIVAGVDPDADNFADRFYEAGADDATVIYQGGVPYLDFDREARTFEDAVMSAQADILKAGATPVQVWRH